MPATAEVFMPYRGPEAGIFPKPSLRLGVSTVDDLEGILELGEQRRETGRRRMITPTRWDLEQVTIMGHWIQSLLALWDTVWNSSGGPSTCQPQPRSVGMQQRIEPIKTRLQELMAWEGDNHQVQSRTVSAAHGQCHCPFAPRSFAPWWLLTAPGLSL